MKKLYFMFPLVLGLAILSCGDDVLDEDKNEQIENETENPKDNDENEPGKTDPEENNESNDTSFEDMSQQQGVTVSGMEGEYTYVDLGLSVMWATYNIGASNPWEYGDLYSWGETTTKDIYSSDNYKWGVKKSIQKYCSNSSMGVRDDKYELDPKDDAAIANWQGKWRMPTKADLLELQEECDWTWTDNFQQSGISGAIGTSKRNGNTIFLPTSGMGSYKGRTKNNEFGFYWSSWLDKDGIDHAYMFRIEQSYSTPNKALAYTNNNYREYGKAIRPVFPSPNYVKTPEYSVSGTMGNHSYVDLGLSVMWATCNVGATQPTEFGDLFAWGETTTKETFSVSNYKWKEGSSITKYCTKSNYGTIDDKTILDPEDDAATVNWGGTWRMPTYNELKELIGGCKWEWSESFNGSGIEGVVGTSEKNGNVIFLPATGWGADYGTQSRFYSAYYGSSSLSNDPDCVHRFDVDFYGDYGNTQLSAVSRYLGHCVRAVTSAQ